MRKRDGASLAIEHASTYETVGVILGPSCSESIGRWVISPRCYDKAPRGLVATYVFGLGRG